MRSALLALALALAMTGPAFAGDVTTAKTEVDAYADRLRGCVGCNHWWELLSGETRHLLDEDIAALRGLETA